MVKVIENYIIQDLIGKGQYGEVFKGYNKLSHKPIAVKAVKRKNLNGKYYELLENEIKSLLKCNDNINITTLYDIKKTSNNVYLIMEFCEEGDLSKYLEKKGPLDENESLDIFLQLINGFKSLIKNKIIHRDFKLANVLINKGIVKIADFGFSKILDKETYTKTILGSPLNMAPEILAGTDYNNKVDIWSLGTCFYQLLFNEYPFLASNLVELQKIICQKPFSLPSDNNLCPEIKDVLQRMLVVNPMNRIEWEDLFNHPIVKSIERRFVNFLKTNLNKQDLVELFQIYCEKIKIVENFEQIGWTEKIQIHNEKNTVKAFQKVEIIQINEKYNNIIDIVLYERNQILSGLNFAFLSQELEIEKKEEFFYFLLFFFYKKFKELKKKLLKDLKLNDYFSEDFVESRECYRICKFLEKEIYLLKQVKNQIKKNIRKNNANAEVIFPNQKDLNSLLKEKIIFVIQESLEKSKRPENLQLWNFIVKASFLVNFVFFAFDRKTNFQRMYENFQDISKAKVESIRNFELGQMEISL